MFRSLSIALENVVFARRCLFLQQPQIVYGGAGGMLGPAAANSSSALIMPPSSSILDDLSTWFAVPKQKVSHSKKRLKQRHKNVFPLKKNIITCPRTGELTLRHKLPINWRDYIPEFEYEEPESTDEKA